MPAAQPWTRHTTGTCTDMQQRHQAVGGRRHPALDRSHPGTRRRRGRRRCGPRCRRRRRSGRPRRPARSPAPARRARRRRWHRAARSSSRRRGRCACRAGRASGAGRLRRAPPPGRAPGRRDRRWSPVAPGGAVAEPGGDGVEGRLQVGGPAGRIGEAHRARLAARQQDRGVARRGDLAPLVLGHAARGRRRAGRRRPRTCGSTVPRSHCVSPT